MIASLRWREQAQISILRAMPIMIRMEEGILIADFHGALSSADLLDGARRVGAIEDREAITCPRIVDLSRLESLHIDFVVMYEFAKIRSESKLKNAAKSAIVAPSQVQYGFARMYQSLNQNALLEVQVFRAMELALKWIRSS